MFEYEDGLLVVDELIFDPSLPNAYVVRINDDYYMIRNSDARNTPIREDAVLPYKKKVHEGWRKAEYNYLFITRGLMPRGGFEVEVGRPITVEEIKEIRERYGLTDADVSNEFKDKRGGMYGKYAQEFSAVQIRVPDGEAIRLESELKEKGIEAGNIAPGRVNIRTDWGGYREGAGRKPTGRKLARIYCTEEEEQKLREYLEKLRNE